MLYGEGSGLRPSTSCRYGAQTYLPSSIDRSRAASTASPTSSGQPVLAHQHAERGGGGAVGAGHLLAQHARVLAALGGERGRAVDRLHGEQLRRIGGQAGFFGRRGQAFDEMEDVGRPGARNRRHRIHQAFVVDGRDLAARRQQVGDEVLGRAGDIGVGRRPPSCPCRSRPACSACSARSARRAPRISSNSGDAVPAAMLRKVVPAAGEARDSRRRRRASPAA